MEGRPDTAMPSWHHLSKEDVVDLIGFMRSWKKTDAEPPLPRPHRGRAEFGEIVYNQGCVSCHGRVEAG